MPFPYFQVSGDAQRALENFSAEFDGALASAESDPWAFSFGIVHVGKFRTTYPIPMSAAGYVERKGDDKYRAIGERSVTMVPREFFDGVEVLASKVEAPDFVGWTSEPANIARATRQFPNEVVATMLEANANLSLYADEQLGVASAIPLFSASHKVNILKGAATFDNDHTAAAINAAMFKAMFIRFATRKASNGKAMNLRVTHLLVPPALEQEAKDFLESDQLLTVLSQNANAATPAGFTRNRFANAVQLIVVPEFTSTSYVYPIAADGPAPWIVQAAETPEELVFDKTSEFYKTTGRVKIGYSLIAGAAGALPHAIERIQITG